MPLVEAFWQFPSNSRWRCSCWCRGLHWREHRRCDESTCQSELKRWYGLTLISEVSQAFMRTVDEYELRNLILLFNVWYCRGRVSAWMYPMIQGGKTLEKVLSLGTRPFKLNRVYQNVNFSGFILWDKIQHLPRKTAVISDYRKST